MIVAEKPKQTSIVSDEPRIVLYHVPWSQYEDLTRIFDGRGSLRMTYNRGTLELMTVSYQHEAFKASLDRVISALAFALNVSLRSGGSMTFKREMRERGLEPDSCYWIENEEEMRNKQSFDAEVDPPPDLAVEVEVSASSASKLDVYAGLGFPEIWRYNGESIEFLRLFEDGRYRPAGANRHFSNVAMKDLLRWARRHAEIDESSRMREIVAWVNAGMPSLE